MTEEAAGLPERGRVATQSHTGSQANQSLTNLVALDHRNDDLVVPPSAPQRQLLNPTPIVEEEEEEERRNDAKTVAVGVSVGASQASITLPLFSICLTANLDHECVLCWWVGVIAVLGGVLHSLW
jgi:hypothetical protein